MRAVACTSGTRRSVSTRCVGESPRCASPTPRLDASPDPALDAFLDELHRSSNTAELLAGAYRVALPALARAYRAHHQRTNPLVDHPTRRILRTAIPEIDDALDWGTRALDAIVSTDDAARVAADEWAAHLEAYLTAAGGVDGESTGRYDTSAGTGRGTARAGLSPARDDRFQESYNFDFRRTTFTTCRTYPPTSETSRSSVSARSRWTFPR